MNLSPICPDCETSISVDLGPEYCQTCNRTVEAVDLAPGEAKWLIVPNWRKATRLSLRCNPCGYSKDVDASKIVEAKPGEAPRHNRCPICGGPAHWLGES